MTTKKRKRPRSVSGLSRSLDKRLTEILLNVELLDLALRSERRLSSEFEDHWIEGCRDGMAIAYDLLRGRIQNVDIRSKFEPKPIKVRYYEGVQRTIKDDSLIDDRRRLGDSKR